MKKHAQKKKTSAKKTLKVAAAVTETQAAQQPAPGSPAVIFHNIRQMLQVGLFPGAHAKYIAEAMQFLDEAIAVAQKTPAPVAAETPAEAPKVEEVSANG